MQTRYLKTFFASKLAKFTFGFLAVAFFALIQLSGQGFNLSTVKALSSFNTDPQDKATLRSSNYTLFPNSTSNWDIITDADAGDVVSLAVYYHNSANETAQNVRISMVAPTSSGTSLIASGDLSADNFESSSGQTEIRISSDQTLTYIPGSAKWYPNQSLNVAVLPFGQTGDEVITQGLNIGDIVSGWPSQGSVVARFQVSNNSVTPPTVGSSVDITANGSQGPVTLSQNQSFTVDWISANATNCSVFMDGNLLSGVASNGSMGPITSSHPFYPAQGTSATFTVECSGLSGLISDSVVVSNPNQGNPPTLPQTPSLSVATGNSCGGSVELSWNTVAGATSYKIFRGGVQILETQNTSYTDTGLVPDTAYFYTIKASNSVGDSSASASTGTVSSATCTTPQSSVDITANGSQGPVTLSQNQSFTVDWISANATNCTVSVAGLFNTGVASNGSLGTINDSHAFYPPAGGSNVFVINCDGLNGNVTDSVEVNRPQIVLPPPTAPTLSAITESICGGQILLNWNIVYGATSYQIFRDGVKVSEISGTSYIDSGLAGGSSHSYTVKSVGPTGVSVFSNTSTATASADCPIPQSSVDITANGSQGPVTLSQNQSFTVDWISANATNCTVSVAGLFNTGVASNGSLGPIDSNHAFYPALGGSNEFVIVCDGLSGQVTDTVIVNRPNVILPPLAPTITASTGSTCGGEITLSWNSVSGATEYKVFRNTSQIATVTGSTSYTDKSLTSGQSYTYTVKAINSAGQSPFSNSASADASGPCQTAPSAPVISAITDSACGGNILLSWNAVSGATAYKIFRNDIQVASTASTSYTDTGLVVDTSFTYKVKAVNNIGNSPFSNSVSAVSSPACAVIPNAPVISVSTGTACGGTVLISWNQIQNAASYNIYRDGVLIASTFDVSYTDTGLTSGQSYSYTIKAINSAGQSPFSNSASANASGICIVVPVAPTLSGSSGQCGGEVNLSWTTITNATSYKVFRDGIQIAITPDATYVDKGITPDSIHSYTVKAVNTAGESGDSNISRVRASDLCPIEDPQVSLTATPATIFKGQNSTLSWTSLNTSSCSALWTTSSAVSGSQVVNPEITTTYSITCEKGANTVTDTVIVTVVEAPVCYLPEITSSLNVSGKVGDVFSYTFSVASSGTSTAYTLATSSLPAGLTLSGDSISGTPTVSGTFSIEFTATNECGSANEVLTIVISPKDNPPVDPSPTVKLNANPLTIFEGATTTLSWTSTNTNSCSALWTTATSTSGNQIVSPATTTTYSITCEKGVKTATDTVTVDVTPVSSPIPDVTLSANPQTIIRGNSSTLSWVSSNVKSCSAVWTTATSTTGTQLVSPTGTTAYEIVCTGLFGNATSSTTVIVNEPSSGGGGGGGGGSSRRVSSTPQVLGDEVSCEYLKDYLRIDWINDPVEVIKLQVFLKELEGFGDLQVTRIFDQATFDATAIFQERYFNDILRPWGHDRYTGFVYILTKKKVNEIFCQRAFPLNASQKQEIVEFRAFLEGLKSQGISIPELEGNTIPDEVGVDNTDTDSVILGIGGSIKDILDGIDSEKNDPTNNGGLFGNRDIRAVAGAVFAGPQGTDASLQAIVMFLLSLLAAYVLSRLTENIWKTETLSLEAQRMRKISTFTLGLVLVVILCFALEYYAIVLPLLVLIIILSCVLLWLALTKPKASVPMIVEKIEEKKEDTHILS